MSAWTAEDDAQLRALVAARLTGSRIGLRLGRTRNAVIARMSALGIKSQITRADGPRLRDARAGKLRQVRTSGSAVIKPHERKSNAMGFCGVPKPKPDGLCELKPSPDDPPLSECITIADLASHHCRWPLSGRYCGKQRVRGAYCAAHAARAHREP